jgi:hypothetical protein
MAALIADLSSIPGGELSIKKGADRKKYYCVHYEIRINFESAHIKYSSWYKNKC